MDILAIGDMHLGRLPSRIPEPFQDRLVELGPAGTWKRIVTQAIRASVDVVLLAGDLVESERDFFESHRLLRQGIEQLSRAGIQVIGIAGNHDVQVLPRLAEQIEGFRLLGAGGTWEHMSLNSGQVELWGWSFPERHVSCSPLTGIEFTGSNSVLRIGLLHADRDQPQSAYAPVSSAELQAAGLDAWLLGHIHKPDDLQAPAPMGYLGSVVGLDPGEPGPHGPWHIRIQERQITHIAHWPLAGLRWEQLQVDVEAVQSVTEALDRILDALQAFDSQLVSEPWAPDVVGLRLVLRGAVAPGILHQEMLGQSDRDEIFRGSTGIGYFVETLRLHTQPPIALAELAQRRDPLGILAHRLLLLEQGPDDEKRQALLAQAGAYLQTHSNNRNWQALGNRRLQDDDIADWLRQSGMQLLEQMLEQQERRP